MMSNYSPPISGWEWWKKFYPEEPMEIREEHGTSNTPSMYPWQEGDFIVKDTKEETVLQEAQRIIYGDREKTYGHPAKNFENTAALWNVYLVSKFGPTATLLGVNDVALMMVLLKIARELHQHKKDNIVDICGYAACIQKIEDFKNE